MNIAVKEPLNVNKQFNYTTELKFNILLKSELPDKLMEYYLAEKKLNDFLKLALKNRRRMYDKNDFVAGSFKISNKEVRQLGEISKDNGARWQAEYDLMYKK